MLWLKAIAGIGILYLFSKRTDTGAAIVAELRGCPAGMVPGPWPWSQCVPTCGTGESIAVSPGFTGTPAGTLYCSHQGGVGFAGDSPDSPVTSDPVDNTLSVQVGPVTSPHDPGGGL